MRTGRGMGTEHTGVAADGAVAGEGSSARYGPLVAAIATGDPRAESEFVASFGPGVRALVRRHARPREPAIDDLSQEVLRQVLEALRRGDLRDAAALPTYVRSTVVNAVRAEYRRRERRDHDSAPDVLDHIPAADDPAAATQRVQLARAVRELLAELPVERDRQLLRRFYLDEDDANTVCADLGIEASHFRRVAHRARERLRELLLRAGLGEAS